MFPAYQLHVGNKHAALLIKRLRGRGSRVPRSRVSISVNTIHTYAHSKDGARPKKLNCSSMNDSTFKYKLRRSRFWISNNKNSINLRCDVYNAVFIRKFFQTFGEMEGDKMKKTTFPKMPSQKQSSLLGFDWASGVVASSSGAHQSTRLFFFKIFAIDPL